MAHGEKMVLVAKDDGTPANTGFQPDGDTYINGTAGDIGIWCLDVKDAVTDTTKDKFCDGAGNFLFMKSGVLQAQAFQIVQPKTTGAPKTSPILFARDLKRIEYRIHVDEVAATSTWTPTAANNTMFAIRLVQLGSGLAGDYEAQINPTNDSLENVGQVYYYEYTADATATATEICNSIRDQINADTTNPFTATGTATLIVTATNMESDFKCIDASTGTASWSAALAVGTDGEGNGRQVVGAEKLAEGYYGHHNRLDRARSVERFAVAATDYDSIIFTFDHGPGSEQARRTNRINDAAKYGDYVVECYFTAVWADGSSNINEVLPIANGVNEVINDFGW